MKRKLLVIVNGQPREMEFDRDYSLMAVKIEALTEAEFPQDRPWQMVDENGAVLDETLRVSELKYFREMDRLYICLRAGLTA